MRRPWPGLDQLATIMPHDVNAFREGGWDKFAAMHPPIGPHACFGFGGTATAKGAQDGSSVHPDVRRLAQARPSPIIMPHAAPHPRRCGAAAALAAH